MEIKTKDDLYDVVDIIREMREDYKNILKKQEAKGEAAQLLSVLLSFCMSDIFACAPSEDAAENMIAKVAYLTRQTWREDNEKEK